MSQFFHQMSWLCVNRSQKLKHIFVFRLSQTKASDQLFQKHVSMNFEWLRIKWTKTNYHPDNSRSTIDYRTGFRSREPFWVSTGVFGPSSCILELIPQLSIILDQKSAEKWLFSNKKQDKTVDFVSRFSWMVQRPRVDTKMVLEIENLFDSR